MFSKVGVFLEFQGGSYTKYLFFKTCVHILEVALQADGCVAFSSHIPHFWGLAGAKMLQQRGQKIKSGAQLYGASYGNFLPR